MSGGRWAGGMRGGPHTQTHALSLRAPRPGAGCCPAPRRRCCRRSDRHIWAHQQMRGALRDGKGQGTRDKGKGEWGADLAGGEHVVLDDGLLGDGKAVARQRLLVRLQRRLERRQLLPAQDLEGKGGAGSGLHHRLSITIITTTTTTTAPAPDTSCAARPRATRTSWPAAGGVEGKDIGLQRGQRATDGP